ncbi:translation initiation factor IF-2 [Nodularia spumigena CENA596]|uniref:Translation initiation factor IF-2 n=1 Tax=Nodularia spumigena CENA596 TaxID=1819295 RepID=A0A166ITW7_NODSP|nr:translation initiation factor IF-2 [Nodularia spumigena CCY9414]KZL48840.1 translation initiation factor IF-2 [Nodularia spumigena CENA596]
MLWTTQNQQNKKLKNGNLVALRRSLASTIIPGGNVRVKPKHLSFLTGGTGKITKGNLKTVIEGWRCRKPGNHPLKNCKLKGKSG